MLLNVSYCKKTFIRKRNNYYLYYLLSILIILLSVQVPRTNGVQRNALLLLGELRSYFLKK